MESLKSKVSLSVIMSVYFKDNPIYLKQALSSISSQTLLPTSVYIVFDGLLPDALETAVIEWSAHVKFSVFIIRNRINMGLSVSLNKALNLALEKSEFIARVDSDDVNISNRFEVQINFLQQHDNVDVVGSYISEIDENGDMIKDLVYYPTSHSDCFEFFKKRDPLAHPVVMFRKSFFMKAGLYSERHVYPYNYEDTMLWFEGFKAGCVFSNIPQVLLKFRRTNAFYERRGGFVKACNFLKDRFLICDNLNFGGFSKVYALLYFLLSISPSFVKKIVYSVAR